MKQAIAAVLLSLISFTGFAMEDLFSNMSTDVIKIVLSFLYLRDLSNIGLTNKRLHVVFKDYHPIEYKNLISFQKIKNKPIVFCCSQKTFCILQEADDSTSRSKIKMFDDNTLQERNSDFEIKIVNNFFTNCGNSICYNQDQMVALLSVDNEEISSKILFNNDTKISKLSCIDDNIVMYENDIGVTTVFNFKKNERTFISGKITHISGIGNDIHIFYPRATCCILRGVWTCQGYKTSLWIFPISACANNQEFMVTCNIDEESDVQKFYKTIFKDDVPVSTAIKLTLPLSISVTKLFLNEKNKLVVVGTVNKNSWLLLMYSVDEDKTILRKTFEGKPAEVHIVKNNIFVVFKICHHEEKMENFEIKVITINKQWLH